MKENWVYRRGDLYLANLGVPVGSKQVGVRPVVVLQNDVGNYYAPTITIVPLTSKIEKKRKQPTHFFLRKAKGLAKPSMVLAEQLDTCDKICVIRHLGRVSKGQMRGIDEAVRIQLGYYIPGCHLRLAAVCVCDAGAVRRIAERRNPRTSMGLGVS